MKDFLREYWLWIAAPFVVVVAGLIVLWWTTSGDGPSPFTYDVLGG